MKKNTPLNLFGSKARTELLVQFFLSSKEKFYMRELERLLEIPIGNLRRELIYLEKTGILKSEKLGNLKFYLLDKENPIYKPMKQLVIKTIGIPEMLKSRLMPNPNIITAFIYGSYARGDFEGTSDVDLFVVTAKEDSSYDAIYSQLSKIEGRFGREINPDIMSLGEFQKRIKSKDPYISDIINNKIIFLKGGENIFRLEKSSKTKN